MKIGRTVLAVIGLLAIALTYITRNLYFLALSIIVFFVGLAVMGAIGRPKQMPHDEPSKSKKGNTRR
ncbi:MAG: hypothetical protein ACYC7D_12635 [Nitrososphaerales archaeon]